MTQNLDRAAFADSAEKAGAPEIEITPAMIEGGLTAYYKRNRDIESDEEIVARIFAAMMQCAFTTGEGPVPAAFRDNDRE